MVKKVKLDDTYESLRTQFNEAVDQIQEMQDSIESINQEQQNKEYVKSIAINGNSITITKNDDTTETLEVGGKIDTSTLVTGLAASGTTITITYGDGHTATITTQDTNTNIITGVKGNAETNYRTGNVNITPANIGAAASSHTHNYAGSSSAGGAADSAVKATQDSAGQPINSTYIKGISISGTTITITKGDGSTSTVTTQDTNTTYGAVSDKANGLATPALLSTANNAVPKSGATMTGALVGQANANYTTAQFRNITMSNAAPTGGSNGQVHFQYS